MWNESKYGRKRSLVLGRPRKWRKVCMLPKSDSFGPLNLEVDNHTNIVMTIEEYETIRLIDLEANTQEECASKMNIARTTVQGIYLLARKKLAQSLINGKPLKIEGGDYELCNGCVKNCSYNYCKGAKA